MKQLLNTNLQIVEPIVDDPVRNQATELEQVVPVSPSNDSTDEQYQLIQEFERLKHTTTLKKSSRDFYRHIVQGMLDVAVMISLEGIIEYVSPSITRFAGYTPEEICGTHIGKYFAKPEELAYVCKIRDLIQVSPKPFHPIEFMLKAKERSPFYVEAFGRSSWKENGSMTIEITLRNIEERKRMEMKLQESEAKYRDFFDNLADFAYIHDLDGVFIDANNTMIREMNHYKQELGFIKITDMVPEINQTDVNDYLKRIITQGRDKGILKIFLPDGSVRYFKYNNTLITGPNGPTAVRGSASDVTRRIEMQRKLKESEIYYQSVFENTGSCIFIIEEDLTIASINSKGASLLGYSKEEIEGKTKLISFFSPENKNELLQNGTFKNKRLNGVPLQYEAVIVDRFGIEHWMLVNTRRIPKTCKMIASAIEISNLKKTEEELKASQAELEKRVIQRTQALSKSNRRLEQEILEHHEAEKKLRLSELEYRRLFEHTGLSTFIVDKDMTIAKVNEVFTSTSGYPKEMVEGKAKWPDLIYSEDLADIKRIWDELLTNMQENPWMAFECRGRKSMGEIVNIKGRLAALADADQIVATFIDVTDIKQTKAALIESEQRLSTLMNNLPGIAYSCEDYRNLTFSFVSEGCRNVTGFETKYLVGADGRHYRDLIDPEDVGNVSKQIEKAIDDRSLFQISYRIRTADQAEKWVLQTGQGIYSDAGAFVSMEGIIIDATARVKEEQALKKEYMRLKSTIAETYKFGNIIGKSQLMQNVYQLIIKAGQNESNVIIYGESGTGKELVAKAIHGMSDRRKNAFIAVNCGAIPENLFESEFFGYKKGAFTGASHDKKGYFDKAAGGTLFLDELGEISLGMQVKLLRVLETGEYIPVGSTKAANSNVRIICATNKNLKKLVHNGSMREDFFYRIHIIPISLPPLRKRVQDLPLLIDHFLHVYGKKETMRESADILEKFKNYSWPGNIRELQNVILRYITIGTLDFMSEQKIPSQNLGTNFQEVLQHDTRDLRTILSGMEKVLLNHRLNQYGWNKSRAADDLGIDRKTLLKKIKQYDLNQRVS